MTALTYHTQREKSADRDLQSTLLKVLVASPLALRIDECGAWRINGKRGHIYTWGPTGGWLIYCDEVSARQWSANKTRLSFCKVTQNGEIGGYLQLSKLPTPQQAAAVRSVVGIRRRRSPSHPVFHPRLKRVSEPGIEELPSAATTVALRLVDGFQQLRLPFNENDESKDKIRIR